MLDEMSPRDWAGWLAYAELEPFGEERGDLRAGIIAATIASAAPGKKRRKRFRPRDFMPRFGKRRRQSPETMYAIAVAFAHAHNATIKTPPCPPSPA